MTFDTLKAARRLRNEGGFNEKQAGILVDTFAEGMDETLATKADLEKTELVLRGEIGTLRGEAKETEATLRGEIGTLRGEAKQTEAALRGEIKETEATLRGEIKETEATLRGEIKETKAALQKQMEKLEKRMVVRFGAMQVATVTLIVALIKFT